MNSKDVLRLVERAEAAGVVGQLEAQFAHELNAFANGDEGHVPQEQLDALAQAARGLLGDTRRYFVTEITLQVLSEDEPVLDMDIAEISEEMTTGDFSGLEIKRVSREVGPVEMAELLHAQGSDPEFFRLAEDGEQLDD